MIVFYRVPPIAREGKWPKRLAEFPLMQTIELVCGLGPPGEVAARDDLRFAQELPLDLSRDLIQPSLGPLCPVLLVPGMGLKLSYPIFSGAKLSR